MTTTTLDLLDQLLRFDAVVMVDDRRRLVLRHYPSLPLPPDMLDQLRIHAGEIRTLVDGSTCRRCRQSVGVKPFTVSNGTTVCGPCLGPFERERKLALCKGSDR